jgi:hypothetical protein
MVGWLIRFAVAVIALAPSVDSCGGTTPEDNLTLTFPRSFSKGAFLN